MKKSSVRRWAYAQVNKEEQPLSPVTTMIVILIVGGVLSAAAQNGNLFLCSVLLAPLMAVMAKRSEDRRAQKEQTELLRQIAEQNKKVK